ncbi:hypothetical protein SPBR_01539 [Sporothrix brasiliensis 5110]|uniref:Uncharacterized protein n=1 Tax=Sporothrix brasiliensis 5110 TaxID=1398154 RepID=A0A0C2FK44_9PEZI|nr:uncharacterized protein SPBR_01539 [Sporothrix brasiliensis 5110]KIH91398.1 hypothetical protein SPBR_01539 [Sporothrix brasiliensis 5110]
MSPETASPVYPDRLIHPLPKRRLRERLSSDAADSIKYPPDQTPGAPLFYYPYSLKQDAASVERPIFVGQARAATLTAKPTITAPTASTPTTTAATTVPAATGPNAKPGSAPGRAAHLPSRPRRSSGENEAASSSRTTRAGNRSGRSSQALHMSPAQGYWTLPSSTLTADGFDSFEYTSNTKKRKIPSAGDTSHTGSYTSTSLRSTASESSTTTSSYDSLAGSPPLLANVKPTGFVAASVGISGPGRGRYGRSQRHPIIAAEHTNNAGIISSAIANAERQGPRESTDLASQFQATEASAQGSLQFTFTCSSKVPGNLLWSGSDSRTSPSSANWQQGQQQGRIRGGQGATHASGSHLAGSVDTNGSPSSGKASKVADGSRSKQQLEKEENFKIRQELRKQARDRRRRQQELNVIRPTPESEIYICPFCEYENITGHKPRLIYEFEMKERKKRLELERRQREQRNREKARHRNRKGRKAAKAAPTTAGSSTLQESLDDDQQYDDIPDDTGQGIVDDDDYEDDDDYDDDDGAGEADDFVAELRLGIGDANNPLLRGRGGENMQPIPAGG